MCLNERRVQKTIIRPNKEFKRETKLRVNRTENLEREGKKKKKSK